MEKATRFGGCRQCLAGTWLFAGLSVTLVVVAPTALHAQSCTSAGGTVSCTGVDFTTSGQSMFGLGSAQVSSSVSVGTNWNASGSVGSIVDAGPFGSYGGEISGSSQGSLSFSASAVASGGTVSANIPVSISLQLPTAAVQPGNPFTVTSNLTYNNPGFSTQSPSFGFGAAVGFNISAGFSASGCFAVCEGFSTSFNTGQQTLNLIQYNETGSVANPTLGGGQTTLLGANITGQVAGLTSISKNFGPYVSLSGDLNPADLQIVSQSAPGTLTASGTAAGGLTLSLDAINALSAAAGIPPLSGSLGDLVCTALGGSCGSGIQGLLNEASYNLIAGTASLQLAPSQTYQMALNGATLNLNFYDSNTHQLLGSSPISAEGSSTVVYPTNISAGASVIVQPVLTLNDPTLTTQTGVTLTPSLNLSAVSLDVAGVGFGPLYSYSPAIAPVQLASGGNTSAQIGGFTGVTLQSSTIGADVTDFRSAPSSSTTLNFALVNGSGQPATSWSSLNINNSTIQNVTYAGTNNSSGTNTATIQGAPTQTTLENVTMNFGTNNQLNTGGSVTFMNSSLSANAGVSSWGLTAGAGTLSFENTTVSGASLTQQTSSSNLVLQNSSYTGSVSQFSGTLTLENSTLTGSGGSNLNSAFGGNILNVGCNLCFNGTVNVGGGAVLENTSRNYLYAPTGTINIGAGGHVQVDSSSHVYGGTWNIAAGGLLTIQNAANVDSLQGEPSQTVYNGGTIEFTAGSVSNAGSSIANIVKPLNGPGGTVIVQSGGSGSFSNATGMSNVTVTANGRLTFTGTSSISADTILNQGEFFLNNTTITGMMTNSAGFLDFDCTSCSASISNLTLTGGQVIVEPDTTLRIGDYTQMGGVTFVEGTLALTSAMQLAGGLLLEGGEIDGSLDNVSGTVEPGPSFAVDGLADGTPGTLTITGDYTQDPGGILNIAIVDLTHYTQLDVMGMMDLAGTLDVGVNATFLGQLERGGLGDSFDILNFGSLQGAFTNLVFNDSNGAGLPFGLTWDLVRNGNQLDLVWSTAHDCAALGEALLNGTPASPCTANLPANGTIPPDFGTNSTGTPVNFQPSPFTPTPVNVVLPPPVPEPGTFALLLGGAALAALRYRARRGLFSHHQNRERVG